MLETCCRVLASSMRASTTSLSMMRSFCRGGYWAGSGVGAWKTSVRCSETLLNFSCPCEPSDAKLSYRALVVAMNSTLRGFLRWCLVLCAESCRRCRCPVVTVWAKSTMAAQALLLWAMLVLLPEAAVAVVEAVVEVEMEAEAEAENLAERGKRGESWP